MSRVAISGLFLVTFLAACGGRGEPDQTTPDFAYPTEQSFCAAIAEVECNQAVVRTCYGSDDSTLAADAEACKEARVQRCNPDGLPYHPEDAEACVSARRDALSDAVWTRPELDAVFEACLPVLSNKVPEGRACASDHDCDAAVGLRCITRQDDLQGVCAEPVTASGGEPCEDPAIVCEEAYYCGPGAHCIVKPRRDEACSARVPCAPGFYCSGQDEGTCLPKIENGAACNTDAVCAGGFCIGRTSSRQGVCAATLPLTITSSTCDLYR